MQRDNKAVLGPLHLKAVEVVAMDFQLLAQCVKPVLIPIIAEFVGDDPLAKQEREDLIPISNPDGAAQFVQRSMSSDDQIRYSGPAIDENPEPREEIVGHRFEEVISFF